jgi:hypothetical protein
VDQTAARRGCRVRGGPWGSGLWDGLSACERWAMANRGVIDSSPSGRAALGAALGAVQGADTVTASRSSGASRSVVFTTCAVTHADARGRVRLSDAAEIRLDPRARFCVNLVH